jgi:methionyl-tRNA formyltransferase
VTPHEQQQTVTTYSRKLTKQDGALLFTKTASELEREVRAFSGWPKSRTVIAGNDCVITIAKVAQKTLPLGTIEITPENTIIIGCRVASLEIIELQPAGKNKMPVSAFLNGYGHLL